MEKARKILIFSLVYYPRLIGGAEVAIKEITDRIESDKFEFDMVTLKESGPSFEKIGNVNVYRVGPLWLNRTKAFGKLYKYFFVLSAFFKAVSLNRKNHYDIVWAMMAAYAGFAALLFNIFHPKIPFLLSLQEGDPIHHIKIRARFVYPFFKMIFKRADMIQAISGYLAEFGVSMGYPGKPVVIPNGVDINRFDTDITPAQKLGIREELGLKGEDVALVTASRLVVKNGVGGVIKALAELPANVKFVVLGEGGLKEKLTKLASDLKVSERVIFKGFVPHSEMPKYLKSCDIFIRPSLSEGLGNSFLEAMAAGLPVIATPVGGIVDFLEDGRTGYFCKPESPRSIAEAVEKAIKDPRKDSVRENAYKMVVEKYDWDVIVSQMKVLFDSIANK